MKRALHIVCLDVPYPPDYGGVFDLFFKIKYLSAEGVSIILHCFEYGRGQQRELEKYCQSVYYYPRNKWPSLTLPYIVSSRRNKDLIRRLSADTHPVILEGIHCTYYIYKKKLAASRIWVRLHNVEFEYYSNLARTEKLWWKKIYFRIESRFLKRYETQLCRRARFLAVSVYDEEIYRKIGATDVRYFPLFLNKQHVTSKEGMGDFCLYHGNLAVAENEEAVLFLIKSVFHENSAVLKIAGKNPTTRIRQACIEEGVELIENPDQAHMDTLLQNAHIHVLPSFNTTGIKIKLIEALYKGRFVITNPKGIIDGRLGTLCRIAFTSEEWREQISDLMKIPLAEEEIEDRRKVLTAEFDPEQNARELAKLVFS